jgi:hypothetical protein
MEMPCLAGRSGFRRPTSGEDGLEGKVGYATIKAGCGSFVLDSVELSVYYRVRITTPLWVRLRLGNDLSGKCMAGCQ